MLIVIHNMIADIPSNEKLNSLVTKLFITGREPSISLIFMM